MEGTKEIRGSNNKSFDTWRWKSVHEMVESIKKNSFDHMIISHAIPEKMTLVSSDQRFPFYRRQGLNLLFNKK